MFERDIEFRRGFAIIVLVVGIAMYAPVHSWPGYPEWLLWIAALAPAIPSRRLLWTGYLVSGLALSLVAVQAYSFHWKGNPFVGWAIAGAAALMFAAAAISYRRRLSGDVC
jgi:hypothetical protein